jgi:hypothetical protein
LEGLNEKPFRIHFCFDWYHQSICPARLRNSLLTPTKVAGNEQNPIEDVIEQLTEPTVPALEQQPCTGVQPPAPGTGNLSGRLIWNDQPVANQIVEMCLDANYKDECEGTKLSIQTAADGTFLFQDVIPDEYDLVMKGLDPIRTWVQAMDIDFVVGQEIKSGECLILGDVAVTKYDLNLSAPFDGSAVQDPQPVLSWQAYPDAAFYEVSLESTYRDAIFMNQRTNQPELKVPVPLQTCSYFWLVDAFNAQGTKIAQFDGYPDFDLSGGVNTCFVTGLNPLDGAIVGASNPVLKWDPIAGATKYKLSVTNRKSFKDVVDLEMTETTYTINEVLTAGEYFWNVYAYDQFDNRIGKSEQTYFEVR